MIACDAQDNLNLASLACPNYREIDDRTLSAFADLLVQFLQIARTLGVYRDNGVVRAADVAARNRDPYEQGGRKKQSTSEECTSENPFADKLFGS